MFKGLPVIPIKFRGTLLYLLLFNTNKVTGFLVDFWLWNLHILHVRMLPGPFAKYQGRLKDLNQAQSRRGLYLSPDRRTSIPDA